MQLEEGSKAPDFSLPDQDGNIKSLNDYAGKWLVLYFYPKDFTSGCTTEACSLQENLSELSKLAEVVGVSKDSSESHQKFSNEYKLEFTLLSDTDNTVHKLYDAHALLLNKRVTYLINPAGVIKKIYKNVDPTVHAKELMQDLSNV